MLKSTEDTERYIVVVQFNNVDKSEYYNYSFRTQEGAEWLRRKLLNGTTRVRNVLLREMGFKDSEVGDVTYKYIMHIKDGIAYQHIPQYTEPLTEKDL